MSILASRLGRYHLKFSRLSHLDNRFNLAAITNNTKSFSVLSIPKRFNVRESLPRQVFDMAWFKVFWIEVDNIGFAVRTLLRSELAFSKQEPSKSIARLQSETPAVFFWFYDSGSSHSPRASGGLVKWRVSEMTWCWPSIESLANPVHTRPELRPRRWNVLRGKQNLLHMMKTCLLSALLPADSSVGTLGLRMSFSRSPVVEVQLSLLLFAEFSAPIQFFAESVMRRERCM